MKDAIKLLLALQERDLEIDRLKAESAAIPAKASAVKAEIQGLKTALDDAKKELTQHQLNKKQKEIDLETQEGAIRKHAGELNAVKSNEAYKALLGEIERAKSDKSALEDQILQLMEQIDQATRVWKEKEANAKNSESGLLKQVADLEAKQKSLDEEAAKKTVERDQAFAELPPKLSDQYARIRNNKKGAAVVALRGEQCSGCHMRVSQNLINEVRRAQTLMTCESCSRIVYLEEALAA